MPAFSKVGGFCGVTILIWCVEQGSSIFSLSPGLILIEPFLKNRNDWIMQFKSFHWHCQPLSHEPLYHNDKLNWKCFCTLSHSVCT